MVDPALGAAGPCALVGSRAGTSSWSTVSDSGRHGGFGSALADALRAAECDVPLRDLAIPQEFLEHGNRPTCWPPSGWRRRTSPAGA